MWDDGAIWQGAREGGLRLRACRACARFCHPPLPVCPTCQGNDWETRDATGSARLHAWCASSPPDGDGQARTIVVAELAEGVRFVANLVAAPRIEELSEGMPLTLCFIEQDGDVLPAFRPADGAGA